MRIKAPLASQSAIALNDDTNGQDIVLYRPGATRDFRIYTTTAGDAVTVSQAGAVGIATSSPNSSYKLHVNGNAYIGTYLTVNTPGANWAITAGASDSSTPYGTLSYGTGVAGYFIGPLYYTSLVNVSDRRLKDDIQNMDREDALNRLMRLTPVSYRWKPDADQAKTRKGVQYGLVAQDVKTVLPEVVVENEMPKTPAAGEKPGNETLNQRLGKTYAVEYTSLIPWLLSALQELKSLFDGDHGDLMRLKAANDNQATQIEELRQEFRAYKATHP